jgi:uncharacterized protein
MSIPPDRVTLPPDKTALSRSRCAGQQSVTSHVKYFILKKIVRKAAVTMDHKLAIAMLRQCEPELKAIGVVSASVFGSVARDEAGMDSDVDVAVRLSKDFSEGGFDYFSRLNELERRLSSILGCKVDVIEEPVRQKRLQVEIDRDRAVAF